MSGAGGGGGGGNHGSYRDPASADLDPFGHDDVDSFFFQRSPSCAGDGITAYLQGFLDPAGMLAPRLEGPCRLGDNVAKQEMVAVQVVSGHDGAPATPNASARSSSSSEARGEEEPRRRRCGRKGRAPEEGEEEIDDEGTAADAAGRNNCKRSKGKTRGEKKPREPRVAFMTKSEVDHLEDGYRWRKYGQKAVKNSSYPRSYYRCTAARCGVKKLVERSQQDPATVITTYQGQHTHPSPVSLGRAGAGGARLLAQHAGCSSLAPLHLGFHPDLAMMSQQQIGYARGMSVPGVPPRTPAPVQLRQEHRASSLLATYGGVPDSVPSAMGNGNEHC